MDILIKHAFWFVLLLFASWRVTYLVVKEDGPFDLIARLRVKLGNNVLGRMMDCFYCTNVWISFVFVIIFVAASPKVVILYSLAISGACCIINLIIERICVLPAEKSD